MNGIIRWYLSVALLWYLTLHSLSYPLHFHLASYYCANECRYFILASIKLPRCPLTFCSCGESVFPLPKHRPSDFLPKLAFLLVLYARSLLLFIPPYVIPQLILSDNKKSAFVNIVQLALTHLNAAFAVFSSSHLRYGILTASDQSEFRIDITLLISNRFFSSFGPLRFHIILFRAVTFDLLSLPLSLHMLRKLSLPWNHSTPVILLNNRLFFYCWIIQ